MAMMISKFHKIIQSKIVWTVFAIVISVAFVSVYTGGKSAASMDDNDQADDVVGKLYGEEISRQEYGTARAHVYLMYTMMTGRPLDNSAEVNEAIERGAWQRLAMLKKAEQLGLSATPEQVVQMIQSQPLFMNQDTGRFDRNFYNQFLNGYVRSSIGMGPQAFEAMMRENVLIRKAADMAAQGALVTEQEIKETFHLYEDQRTVQYVTIPRSLAETPEITEEEAKAYFEANQEQFRLPEKAIVKYVEFPVADYTNAVSVTDQMVSAFYENNKQRYLKPAAPDAPADAEPEFRPLDEVKDEIAGQIRQDQALRAAYNAADAMVAELSDRTTTFEQAAEQAGRAIVDNTPAFAATEPVRGVDPSAPFARAAFGLQLNETHYYSDPVAGREKVYVIGLIKKLDSFLPAFDVVKADVMEAARMAADEEAYVEKAEEVQQTVQESVSTGQSFEEAVKSFNLEVQQTEPFTLSEPFEGAFANEIMGATARLDSGDLTDLISTPDEFLLAYVTKREAASETEKLPVMRDQIVGSLRQQKEQAMVSEWQDSLLDEAGFVDLRDQPEETDGES